MALSDIGRDNDGDSLPDGVERRLRADPTRRSSSTSSSSTPGQGSCDDGNVEPALLSRHSASTFLTECPQVERHSKQICGIICFEMSSTDSRQGVEKAIVSRIYGHGRGWVFTPRDFLDLGSRPAVSSALKRQTDSGRIRQLARGLYDYPRQHPQLGLLAPDTDAIAKALSGRDATKLQPSGAYAANLLGLSEQVPMKVVFLTDGPSRRVRVGRQEIILRRTTPRNMATAGRIAGLVTEALRELGPEHVTESVIRTLQARLDEKAKQDLVRDLRFAPAWIASILRKIAAVAEGAS
jgi:hypothetical protein